MCDPIRSILPILSTVAIKDTPPHQHKWIAVFIPIPQPNSVLFLSPQKLGRILFIVSVNL